MNMLSLFSTRSDTSGFRLNYLEVYNWGTFDEEIIHYLQVPTVPVRQLL